MLENLVGGDWVAAEVESVLEDRDPASGELLGLIPLSGADQVDAAVRAAAAAQREWSDVSVLARARAVAKIGELLSANREELAQLITTDMGKTLDDARAEVSRGLEAVQAATAAPMLTKGENLEEVARGVDVRMVRQPVGVVAAITPFNFPAMIPLWFIPYAIATGNALILKPSERDPLASVRIVELIASLEEIPAGVLSLVHGGPDAVNALLDHPGIEAISFVGQAATARHIATRAGENGKRVQARGGAKNAFVLMPDAPLPTSVDAILSSAFGAAGQRCLAGSVLVLVGEPDEQEAGLRRVIEAAARLRSGSGADPATDICPLISPDARERVAAAVAQAEAEGSRVILDGRDTEGPAGTQLGATIVDAAEPESPLVREELFGPVLAVVRSFDLDGALSFLNASRYGNASMIFTESGGAAREFSSRVQAGMIGVNIGVAAPVAWFPFAGWKDSFDGDLHANGADAFEFYTRKKVITSRW